MNYKILKSHISAAEVKDYEDMKPGWTVKTTNCLLVTFEDGTSTTYIIFEGPWTKANMCRDCGSYYEISIGNKIQKIPHLYDQHFSYMHSFLHEYLCTIWPELNCYYVLLE